MAPSPSELALREKSPFNFAVVDEATRKGCGVWEMWGMETRWFFESCWDDDGCWNLPKFIEQKNSVMKSSQKVGGEQLLPLTFGDHSIACVGNSRVFVGNHNVFFLFWLQLQLQQNKVEHVYSGTWLLFYTFFLKSTITPRKFSGLMFTPWLLGKLLSSLNVDNQRPSWCSHHGSPENFATFRFPRTEVDSILIDEVRDVIHGESEGIQESNTPPKRIAGLEQKYEKNHDLFSENLKIWTGFLVFGEWNEISMIYGDQQPWMVDQSAIHPAISLEIPVG